MTKVETQLAGYFARYDPSIARLGKTLRARLRVRLPGLSELVYVYERQRSLVFSYSPTAAGAQGVCGISVVPTEVKLFLAGGAGLSKADTRKLLSGSGASVRYVAIGSIADFDRPEIEALIAAALALTNVRLDSTAKGSVIVKAAAQAARARRARKAAAPSSTRRATKPRR